MRRSTAINMTLLFLSLLLTILALEVAIRIRHGELLHFDSFTAEPERKPGPMIYHARLGWVPRPGRFDYGNWVSNVDAAGFRVSGKTANPTESESILAIGDSFTFGDEVNDSETWAAHLERILGRRVLNAGVGAYGVDQAVLRGELLLEEYRPQVVILSFISVDVSRTELSYYPFGRGWKPYFEIVDGTLTLRNVPVEQRESVHGFQTLRSALGYSYLANTIFSRVAFRWWTNLASSERVHNSGEAVTVELMKRMDNLMKARRGRFIAIALATNGQIGGNTRLAAVIQSARHQGIEIFDLAAETMKLSEAELARLFRTGGHYSPEMNSRIAGRIAGLIP